jgi:transketolase
MNLGPARGTMPGPFDGVPSPRNCHPRRGFEFNGPHATGLDRFYLSPTHYSLVLYAVLVETGRMAEEGLSRFNVDGSTVEMIGAEHSPGMEVMTGSLGQGISQAAGSALARKLRGERGRNWVFMSDGEMQPGQVWEALASMAFYKLDNIGIFVDVNGYQCDGATESVMRIEPIDKKLEAFGCRVRRVDGHAVEELIGAAGRLDDGRPLAVLCDTRPWQGIEALRERAPRFHYVRFADEQEKARYSKLLSEMRNAWKR